MIWYETDYRRDNFVSTCTTADQGTKGDCASKTQQELERNFSGLAPNSTKIVSNIQIQLHDVSSSGLFERNSNGENKSSSAQSWKRFSRKRKSRSGGTSGSFFQGFWKQSDSPNCVDFFRLERHRYICQSKTVPISKKMSICPLFELGQMLKYPRLWIQDQGMPASHTGSKLEILTCSPSLIRDQQNSLMWKFLSRLTVTRFQLQMHWSDIWTYRGSNSMVSELPDSFLSFSVNCLYELWIVK